MQNPFASVPAIAQELQDLERRVRGRMAIVSERNSDTPHMVRVTIPESSGQDLTWHVCPFHFVPVGTAGYLIPLQDETSCFIPADPDVAPIPSGGSLGNTVIKGSSTGYDATWATPPLNPVPMQSNAYISTRTHGLGGTRTGTLGLAANTGYSTPIFIPHRQTFTGARIEVISSQPGAQARINIYNTLGVYVTTFGLVSAAAGGFVDVAVASPYIILEAGMYWANITMNGVSGVTVRALQNAFPVFHDPTTMGDFYGWNGAMALTPAPLFFSQAAATALPVFIALKTL